MKLGLISDIHEHVEFLRRALDGLAAAGVDRIVVLGDLFETGRKIEETCQLLRDSSAVGVWGNHDFGLCRDPTSEMRSRYAPVVLDFMASLQSRYELENCQFAHIEPWLDPENITDLWYFEGPPCRPESLSRIFAAAPHRFLFAGHYHRWLLATATAITEWNGAQPIRLAKSRCFVVVGALCEGCYATFDTQTFELCPFHLASAGGV